MHPLYKQVRILSSLALIATMTLAPAQDDGEPDSGRTACFIHTAIPAGVDNPVKILRGDQIEFVTLYNRVCSRTIKVPKDGILRLVKEVPDPKDKDKVIYKTLARAVVPEGISRALIILAPTGQGQANGHIFQTRVQSLDHFKTGSFMFVNLTRTLVGVEIADKKMRLMPASIKIHEMSGGRKLESVPYRYSYHDSVKKRWIPLNASMTIASPTRREVFVFSGSKTTGRIRCKGITVPNEPDPDAPKPNDAAVP